MAKRSSSSILAVLLCVAAAWLLADAFVVGRSASALRSATRTQLQAQNNLKTASPGGDTGGEWETAAANIVPAFMGFSFFAILTLTLLWGAFGEEPEKREYDTKPALNFELYAPR